MLDEKLKSFCLVDKDEAHKSGDAVKWARKFLIYLDGSGTNDVNYIQSNFRNDPIVLHALILLMHRYLPSTQDVERISQGVYSPDERDESQDNRNHLTEYLKRIPGKASYDALVDLSRTFPESDLRKYYGKYARDKAIQDAEIDCWNESNFAEFVDQQLNENHSQPNSIEYVHSQLFKACQAVQRNKDFKVCKENKRNRQISDFLEMSHITVQQERPSSISYAGNDDGELDFYIIDQGFNAITIMEALNLNCVNKNHLNQHFDRIFWYDANGLKELILLVYSNAPNFDSFTQRYFEYIESYTYPYDVVDCYEKEIEVAELKVFKTVHLRNKTDIHLTHYIVNFESIQRKE